MSKTFSTKLATDTGMIFQEHSRAARRKPYLFSSSSINMRLQGVQYSGSDSYKFVDKLIKSGSGEMLVVSPYIDNYYARVLLRASRRRRFRVITSPEALLYRHSLLKRLRLHRMKAYAKATAYFAILSAIALYLAFYYLAIPIVLLMLVSFALMIKSSNS